MCLDESQGGRTLPAVLFVSRKTVTAKVVPVMKPFAACLSPLPFPPCLPLRLFPGSAGNSRSSTQMNSYTDSGYQDAGSGYLSSQNLGKADLRMQHSHPGTGTLMRNARAEGQASAQVLPASAQTTYCCCRAQNVTEPFSEYHQCRDIILILCRFQGSANIIALILSL